MIATPFGLVIEIDSFVMASLATGLVRKVLVTVGGASTVRLAVLEAAPAAGVCVVVTPLAVFELVPTLLLVTWTVIVHPVTGRFGTFKLRLVAPTVNAGLLLVPTHVPPIVVELTLMFVKASVKLALLRGMVFGLLRVKVMVLVPATAIVAGANAFAMPGATAFTCRLAVFDAAPAVGDWVLVTPEVVLGFAPTELLVT